MNSNQLGYHPEYGLTDEIRIKAIKDARNLGVKVSAERNRVSTASIYNWRKRAEEAV